MNFLIRKKANFQTFAKTDVNGPREHPLYTFVKTAFPGDVDWNFGS